MSKNTVFSPETVVKVQKGKPTITLSVKSGLISISPSARELLGMNNLKFNFLYDEDEKTGYIFPEEKGFEFRTKEDSKSISLNHSALVRSFLKANIVIPDKTSYLFLVTNGIKPNHTHSEGFLIFPLIKSFK